MAKLPDSHASQRKRPGTKAVTQARDDMRPLLSTADRDFQTAFESGRFPPAQFDHRAHLRLTYIYLAGHDTETACRLMREALENFLARHHIDMSKYHETLTRAWIMAVRHFMAKTAHAESADAFIDQNPQMLDAKIMLTHYSAEVIFSEEARARFVEPNLDPIPRYDR